MLVLCFICQRHVYSEGDDLHWRRVRYGRNAHIVSETAGSPVVAARNSELWQRARTLRRNASNSSLVPMESATGGLEIDH